MKYHEPDPPMSEKEVAAYLGIHQMTVYRLAKAGKIPPLKKVGGRWRCDRVALDLWISEQAAKQTGVL